MSKYVSSSLFVGVMVLVFFMGVTYQDYHLSSVLLLGLGIFGIGYFDFLNVGRVYGLVKGHVHEAFTLIIATRKTVSVKGDSLFIEGHTEEDIDAMDYDSKMLLRLLTNEAHIHLEQLYHLEKTFGMTLVKRCIKIACKHITPEILPDEAKSVFENNREYLPVWSNRIIGDLLEQAREYLDNTP